MRVTRVDTERYCAVCERTLLLGERSTRFSPDDDGEWVDVCQLCGDLALEAGWLKEGSPSVPSMSPDRRRKSSRLSLASILGTAGRDSVDTPVVSEPRMRRLSERELALVEAADLFNSSQHQRSVAGIAKSLGTPRVSVLTLSGVNPDVVITVAWDISWYQYRASLDSAQPVRLEERGHDPSDLDPLFTEWNATLVEDGRIVPDIAAA